MKVERAKRKDFDELMNLMVRSFRTVAPGHPRFERIFPDLYRATTESMARHRIIRKDGKIVASAGLYPLDVKVANVRLRLGGIGGVCSAPAERRQGHMREILTTLCADLKEEGYALSWLTGERARYARFGWETTGSAPQVQFSLPRPSRAELKQWRSTRLKPGNSVRWERVVRAHKRLVTRGICNEADLFRRFNRLGAELWDAEENGRYAYLALNRKWRQLVEWGGHPAGVASLIKRHARGRGLWWAEIPPIVDPYKDFFVSIADVIGHRLSNLAIIDLEALLKMYEPHLQSVWPKSISTRLTMCHIDGRKESVIIKHGKVSLRSVKVDHHVELDALKMVRFLFGPLNPSLFLGPEMRPLDQALPLPFFLPYLWWV